MISSCGTKANKSSDQGATSEALNDDVRNTVWNTYSNTDYHISLEYPSGWELSPGSDDKYEGENGFFQINAISGEGLSIDEVTESDAQHMLKPYGSDPEIRKVEIQEQEARLIFPSSDQPEEIKDQPNP